MPRTTAEIVAALRAYADTEVDGAFSAALMREAATRLENAARPITPAMARNLMPDAHDIYVNTAAGTFTFHAELVATGAIDDLVAAGVRPVG